MADWRDRAYTTASDEDVPEVVSIGSEHACTVERRSKKSPRTHTSASPGSTSPPVPLQLDDKLAAVSSPACSGIVPRTPSRRATETLDAATVREALQAFLDDHCRDHEPSPSLKRLVAVVQGGGSRRRKTPSRGRPIGSGVRTLMQDAQAGAQRVLRSQAPLPAPSSTSPLMPPPPVLHRSVPPCAVLSTHSGDRTLLVEYARTAGTRQQQFWTTARGWEEAAGSATGSVAAAMSGKGQETFLAAARATTVREGKQQLRYFSFGEAEARASRKRQHALHVALDGRSDIGHSQLVRKGGAPVFGQETLEHPRAHAGAAAAFYRAYGMGVAAAPATMGASPAAAPERPMATSSVPNLEALLSGGLLGCAVVDHWVHSPSLAERIASAEASVQGVLLSRDLEEQRLRCGGLRQLQLNSLRSIGAVKQCGAGGRFEWDGQFLAAAYNSIVQLARRSRERLAVTVREAVEAEINNLHQQNFYKPNCKMTSLFEHLAWAGSAAAQPTRTAVGELSEAQAEHVERSLQVPGKLSSGMSDAHMALYRALTNECGVSEDKTQLTVALVYRFVTGESVPLQLLRDRRTQRAGKDVLRAFDTARTMSLLKKPQPWHKCKGGWLDDGVVPFATHDDIWHGGAEGVDIQSVHASLHLPGHGAFNLLLRMRPIADGTAAGIGAFNRDALSEWGLDSGLNLGGTADGAGLAGARATAAGGASALPAMHTVRVFAWDAAHGGALSLQHGSEACSGKMSGNSDSLEHKQVYYKLWHTFKTCKPLYSELQSQAVDTHIEAGGDNLESMLEMMRHPPSWVKQRFESMMRGYEYTANTSGLSQTDITQYEVGLDGLLVQLKHDEGIGGEADGGTSTRLQRWGKSGNVLFVFLERALDITYGEHREWFAESVALLRVAKLWWNGQADYDLGSIVLLPAIVFLRSGGTCEQEPGFVVRDYAAFVLRTLRKLREAAGGKHFTRTRNMMEAFDVLPSFDLKLAQKQLDAMIAAATKEFIKVSQAGLEPPWTFCLLCDPEWSKPVAQHLLAMCTDGTFGSTFPDDITADAAAAASHGGAAMCVLFTAQRAEQSAAAWHFGHKHGKAWREIIKLATAEPWTEPAAFRELAPQLDLIFTCYVDRFCISTLLNELSGATYRAVVKSNMSPHAAESMLLNLQSDVYLRRKQRRAESTRKRAGHSDGQAAIVAAANGAASHAESAYSASARAKLKREGLEPASRQHFRDANLRRKSVSDHAVALSEKLRAKAAAAKTRKGHTPWAAVVASKIAAIAAQGGVPHDVAFEKAETQAAAERVLNSDEQRDAVLAVMAGTPYWAGPALQQWSRISHAAPSVALPLARFLVLAASQKTRQLIGEYLSDFCAERRGGGGGRCSSGGGRGRSARSAMLERQGCDAAKRLRARLCKDYGAASTKHTVPLVPSIAALKAASAAVRKDIQAYCKDPKGNVPVKWKRSAAHQMLLAQHKAKDAFNVQKVIDALLPSVAHIPASAPSATS